MKSVACFVVAALALSASSALAQCQQAGQQGCGVPQVAGVQQNQRVNASQLVATSGGASAAASSAPRQLAVSPPVSLPMPTAPVVEAEAPFAPGFLPEARVAQSVAQPAGGLGKPVEVARNSGRRQVSRSVAVSSTRPAIGSGLAERRAERANSRAQKVNSRAVRAPAPGGSGATSAAASASS